MKLAKLAVGILATIGLLGVNQVTALGAWPEELADLPEWEVTSSSYGGKLLLSDSPEMVNADGIMYQDAVVGNARLFFHHVNDTKTDKVIVAVLENNGEEPAEVVVHRYGLGGPDDDWIKVGKAAQRAYFAGGDLYIVRIPSHGTALLTPELGAVVVKPGMLVNGIYDFMANRKVTVKTVMAPVGVKIENFIKQAKVLPADSQRLRGTFDGCDRLLIGARLYNPLSDGSVAVTLADNVIDTYVGGVDATDGSKVLNYGNYGIVYNIFLPATGDNDISYYMNPRGGIYAGAIGIKYRHTLLDPVETPNDRLFMGKDTVLDYSAVGKFKGQESLWLTFSPPGASNLPVRLIIKPE
ncbi:MAG: hypothetical protein H6Q74_388 [Firmicutes bacterium]|nr:hypothetical protein [Bacillota bacterium]